MNKSSLILTLLFSYSLSYSQITDTGGSVGVGTTSPESKLHVYTGSAGNAPHGFSDLTVEDDTQGMISILTPNNQLGYFGFADSDDSYVGGLQYEHASDKMVFRVNNHTHDMTIGSSGNVGIGNNNPTGDLHLTGLAQRMIFSTTTTQQEESARIEFWEEHTNIESSQSAHFAIQYDGAGDMLRFKGKQSSTLLDVDLMTIKRGGNVGIGTIDPDSKLAVNGTIHTKEVKVDLNGWSDFVFKPNYELRTLEEVEQHIAENGHLPEIPSEAEVTENGINLGEMDAKLLQKIEELTLYMINMNKQLKSQSQKMEQLEQENSELKREVSALKNE